MPKIYINHQSNQSVFKVKSRRTVVVNVRKIKEGIKRIIMQKI